MASAQPAPPHGSTFSRRTSIPASRGFLAGAAAIVAVYLVALVIAAPSALVLALAGACAVGVGLLRRSGLAAPAAVLLGWAPLHLLLLASGGIASPALALTAVWVAGLGFLLRSPAAAVGGAWAGVALLVDARLRGPPFVWTEATGFLVLLVVAAVLPRIVRRDNSTTSAAPAPPGRSGAVDHPPAADSDTLAGALEFIRFSSRSIEATLWQRDLERNAAVPIAWAATDGIDAPRTIPSLDGHPFDWALVEQVPVHLQVGRKPLPREWATTMLVVPLSSGDALLTLAYIGDAPAEAEAVAVRGRGMLQDLRTLLQQRVDARRVSARLHALATAVHAMPAEMQADRFSGVLARTLAELCGAEGAAVAVWSPDDGSGEVLASAGARLSPAALRFRDSDSRFALACKHGTAFHFPDLATERNPLPLAAPGEEWQRVPRSALIQPILSEGRCLAAALVWHSEPRVFSVYHAESVELLCSVAAPPLQSVLRLEALDRRATLDPLTGLFNRGAFDARYAAVCAHFQRYGRPFAVVVLDVDHFKRFNDSWGHDAGDRVLQHVGALLRSSIREVDIAARLGGEEFVLLLPETSLEQALHVAERVRRSLADGRVAWNARSLAVTASLGVAACPETCGVATDTLAEADAALYRSKEAGRNRVSAAGARL